MPEQRKKTSICDIPVCNDKVIADTALLARVEQKEVRKIARFLGGFIRDTIEKGVMETVMVPYFGKFKPRPDYIKNMTVANQRRDQGVMDLYKAIKGKPIKEKNNETL